MRLFVPNLCFVWSLLLCAPLFGQWSITSANTNFTVDFDATVSGVNSGAFAGSGFAPAPTAGQLNSNAFAATGMSDGDLVFGSTSTTGDYARGNSTGGVTTGGFYGFEVATADRALGVQPGGSDFTPGDITLIVINSTAATVSSLSLSYEIWEYNDQGRSNSFNFSYSTDSLVYTTVPALDFSSVEMADAMPSWTLANRSITINVNLSNGDSLYLRFTSDDVSGGGSRDELAIDDITVNLSTGGACTPPSTPASALSFGPVTSTSVSLNWTRGSGDSVLVVARELSGSVVAPAIGTRYLANTTYNSGDDLGGGNYAVYAGTGTTVSVSGLTPSTSYEFLVYEFATSGACYAAAATNDTTTDCLAVDDPSAVSVIGGNKSATINFTNGSCADSVLVVASFNRITGTPNGNNSQYTASTVFGNGTQVATNEYVVLNDAVSVNSVIVTDLNNGFPYYFKVFNSKGTSWSAGVEDSVIPNSIATTGPIMITEIMQNPDDVSDGNGEYFEVYNPTATPIEMNGWTILDAGTNSHTISGSLLVGAYGFAILGINSDLATNGGVPVDYDYPGSFSLSNSDDEIYLEDASNNGIDTVEWDGGPDWPNPTGAAMVFTGFSTDDNNDGTNWAEATKREGFASLQNDFGSPNRQGRDQRVDYQLLYRAGSWNITPDATTGDRSAYIESGQMAVLTNDANVNNLYLQPTAALDMLGNDMTVGGTAFLKSDASGYSQTIGVNGNAEWETFLNSNRAARWFNVGIPVDATLASVSLSDGALVTSADASNPNQVNIYQYEPAVQDPTNLEGSWVATASQGAQSEKVGYSLYLGAPYFGTLPISLTAKGSLLNGNVNTPISQANSGWNFIGNPYTSTIDWNEVINDNPNLNVNYYIFNDNNDSVWIGYNAVAGTPTVTNPGTSINQATQYISPGQAFFVNANTATQVAFQDNQRTVLQNPPLYKKAKAAGIFLTVMTGDSTSDFTYVGFESQAVDSFNSRLDGKKRLNYTTGTPNLYSEVGGTNFMYKFLNDKLTVKSVPINFELGKTANNVQVTAIFTNMNTKRTVELEDKLTGIFTDLTVKGYTFNHQPSFSKDRFVLHFGVNTVGVEDVPITTSQIFTYTQQGRLKVNLEQYPGSAVDIALMDISGRVVFSQAGVSGQTVHAISLSGLAKGVYVVRVLDKGGTVYTGKVVRD